MDQIELERLGIAEAIVLLQGKRVLAEAEGLRLVALEKRLEQLRPRVLEEREKSGLDSLGRETGRPARRTRALDSCENELTDCVRELERARDRHQASMFEAGQIEVELGVLLNYWQEAGGDLEAYEHRVSEAVEAGFVEVRGSRDAAEAQWRADEERAFATSEGMTTFERMSREEAKRYRSAVVTTPPSWGHFAPALQRIAKERGFRLARAVQARLWQSGDIPQGYGLL